MDGLRLPAHVAGVTYPTGCRIRRVRVPGSGASAQRHAAENQQTVIVSRRTLDASPQLAARRLAGPLNECHLDVPIVPQRGVAARDPLPHVGHHRRPRSVGSRPVWTGHDRRASGQGSRNLFLHHRSSLDESRVARRDCHGGRVRAPWSGRLEPPQNRDCRVRARAGLVRHAAPDEPTTGFSS